MGLSLVEEFWKVSCGHHSHILEFESTCLPFMHALLHGVLMGVIFMVPSLFVQEIAPEDALLPEGHSSHMWVDVL